MAKDILLETQIEINAPTDVVWKAITTPSTINKWLFGTQVTTDWKEGSEISYKGEWNGKAYEDKGTIEKFVPEKVFQSTYWSSMSGKEDVPENYQLVTYSLSPQNDHTILTLIQDNIGSEEERDHSKANWETVLQKLKEVVENPS
jgi:uncharacterized protein YndB with AHSA1/START domain